MVIVATMTKPILLIPALIALCAGSSIPLIPGDNRHYVPGVSRYFWMPDGKGVPRLVDMQEPIDYEFLAMRDGSENIYYLYTQSNPTSGQIITNGNYNSLSSSYYSASKPLVLVVHGWMDDYESDVNTEIISAVLDTQDANVIVVDWSHLAKNINYLTAAAGVPDIGVYVGNFLDWLVTNTGSNWNNIHLVGHSLGAHVVGNAGRQVNGKPSRVTGLDAAHPGFTDSDDALDTNAGQYVEAIHTDGGILGLFPALAHADFYPNGGKNPQPGCWISTCSHSRSHELFASTVRTNHLVGKQCSSISNVSDGSCSGSSLNMGNNILTKRGSGIYYLTTESSFPY